MFPVKVTACVFRVFDGKMMIKIKIHFLFAFLGLDIFFTLKNASNLFSCSLITLLRRGKASTAETWRGTGSYQRWIQKVRIDKSVICQNQLATPLAPSFSFNQIFFKVAAYCRSSFFVRVYLVSLRKTWKPSKSFQVSRRVRRHLELEPHDHACAVWPE